ncbi:MAG: hypothetical protein LBO79_03315, partial [Zoogloeaceae bacterium]|nr:hypothetical protein [Zoogloeaceae bacterium]
MPTTIEAFQDAAALRAAALLKEADPNLASASDLLFLSALLSAQRKFAASALSPSDTAPLLAMIAADFEHWISRAANRAALVSALSVPATAQIILSDTPTVAKIVSSPAALNAIADSSAALSAFLDIAAMTVLADPPAFAQMAGNAF